jgi:hypothetical protein
VVAEHAVDEDEESRAGLSISVKIFSLGRCAEDGIRQERGGLGRLKRGPEVDDRLFGIGRGHGSLEEGSKAAQRRAPPRLEVGHVGDEDPNDGDFEIGPSDVDDEAVRKSVVLQALGHLDEIGREIARAPLTGGRGTTYDGDVNSRYRRRVWSLAVGASNPSVVSRAP